MAPSARALTSSCMTEFCIRSRMQRPPRDKNEAARLF
jgi:hypothetical protein